MYGVDLSLRCSAWRFLVRVPKKSDSLVTTLTPPAPELFCSPNAGCMVSVWLGRRRLHKLDEHSVDLLTLRPLGLSNTMWPFDLVIWSTYQHEWLRPSDVYSVIKGVPVLQLVAMVLLDSVWQAISRPSRVRCARSFWSLCGSVLRVRFAGCRARLRIITSLFIFVFGLITIILWR